MKFSFDICIVNTSLFIMPKVRINVKHLFRVPVTFPLKVPVTFALKVPVTFDPWVPVTFGPKVTGTQTKAPNQPYFTTFLITRSSASG